MTGEISDALEVLGAINKEAARRLDRLEEDLYGKDGLRVLITQLTTRLEDVPDKIDALAKQVAGIQATEDLRGHESAANKGVAKEVLKWVSKATAPLAAGLLGVLAHRHWGGHG